MSVVITGYGVLSPLGSEPTTFFENLCSDNDFGGPVSLFDTSGTRCRSAVEMRDFKPIDYLGKANFRPFNRPALFSIIAAGKALAHSGWADREDCSQLGMVLGTTFCSVHTIAAFDHNAQVAGPRYAKPMDFANTVINAAAGQTALWHKLEGPNSTICCGEASGLAAIGYAADMIASGRAEALLAGGVEELCFASFHAFDQAGLPAGSRNEHVFPIPFDARRNGFLQGEGAAFLMLEDKAAAQARGATILAELSGHATGYDVRRGADADSFVQATAHTINKALAAAGMEADQIDGISAAGNGSHNDAWEAQALVQTLGQKPVTALKSRFGEALGASGALQAAAMVASLHARKLPGTFRYKQVDDACPLAFLSGQTQTWNGNTGLVNAHSADGNRAAIILSRHEEPA